VALTISIANNISQLQMPLSPEIKTIPSMIANFTRAGLTFELINALTRGETGRDMAEDGKRLLKELGKTSHVEINGTENIPKDSGGLIVFNHPNMDVLVPAFLTLMIKIKDIGKVNGKLLWGSEVPLFGKFNESFPVPVSIKFIKRFHNLYYKNVISVPMSKGRPDYELGRFSALRKAINSLKNGDFVLVSPEGHVEVKNTISPLDSFHNGSGGLSIMATKLRLPILPVGIWSLDGSKRINLNIGAPYYSKAKDGKSASIEAMSKIADILPLELRGPFLLK